MSWYVIAKCTVLKAWFAELLELNFVQATQNPLQPTIWITKFSVKEQWGVYKLPRTHRGLYFATHKGCIQKQTCRICDREQWKSKENLRRFHWLHGILKFLLLTCFYKLKNFNNTLQYYNIFSWFLEVEMLKLCRRISKFLEERISEFV